MHRISDHPKLAIAALVGVFFVAFALSLYMLPGSASTGATLQLGGGHVTVVSSSGGDSHVVYVHYFVYSNESSNVTGAYYSTTNACVHNN